MTNTFLKDFLNKPDLYAKWGFSYKIVARKHSYSVGT